MVGKDWTVVPTPNGDGRRCCCSSSMEEPSDTYVGLSPIEIGVYSWLIVGSIVSSVFYVLKRNNAKTKRPLRFLAALYAVVWPILVAEKVADFIAKLRKESGHAGES